MKSIKKKCPNCGGNLEIKEGELFGVCDSCGSTVSLSELNHPAYNPFSKSQNKEETKNEDGEYESALDSDESVELGAKQIYEKIELALETENWQVADEYCDELIRRNPKNAYAYLFKLLADLQLYKKEDLQFTNDSFEENENYRLLIRFSDEYLRSEIQGYVGLRNQRIQSENLEDMYKTARSIFSNAHNEKDFQNAAIYFSNLKGYKDADTLYQQCLSEADREKAAELRKKRLKKVFTICVIGGIIIIIILSVLIVNAIKTKKHGIENIEIQIVSMESKYDPNASPYINGCYYVYFDYKLKNNTTTSINYIQIVTYVTNESGKSIGTIKTEFGGYYSSSMSLEAGSTQTHETYISQNQPEKDNFFTTLYNSSMSDFSFRYEIVAVEFSDGYHYYNN